MDIETLVKRFDDYSSTVEKSLGRGGALDRRLDDIEAKVNRAALLGGGPGGETPEAAEQRKAFDRYLRSGDERELKSMSVASDPDGGYTVVTPLASTITRRIFELSPMRQVARVVTTSADAFEELNDVGEFAASWVGETQARPATDNSQLGRLRIQPMEMFAQPEATQTVVEDSSINLEGWIAEKVASRFARLESQAFITGDGALKPRGLLSYPTSVAADGLRPWGTIGHVNTGAAANFATRSGDLSPADALVDLIYALKTDYRQGAAFMMNRQTAATIRKFKDGQGSFIWQPSVSAGEPDLLLGYPVYLAEAMPNIGANEFPVAFGNFREAYTIVDRVGISVLRDPYSNKPFIRFYTRKRVGGAMHNSEAVKLLRVAASG